MFRNILRLLSESKSGYNLFVKDMFKTHKNKTPQEILILSGQVWRNLPKNVKKDYTKQLIIARKIKKLENNLPF